MVKALMLLVAAKAASSYMGSSSSSAATQPPGTSGKEPGTITSGVLKGLPSLDSLMERFRHNGHADKMDSWVGSGQNQPIQPHELEKALGPESIDHLGKETGLPRDQLLSELSKMLPQVVDKLTPNGRPPTPQETAHW
jgi:uncharacterized protein YidB (DUF937 family)